MRSAEDIVETAHERDTEISDLVVENAKHLLGQRVLVNPVVVVEASLRTPADVQSAGDIGSAPVHYLAQLVPIVHLAERHLLHGGTSYNQSVISLVLDVVKGGIERAEVLGRCVFRVVALDHQELGGHLERGVGERTEKLSLSGDLIGHEVEDEDAQGSDVLRHSPLLTHDEDSLRLEYLPCRQSVGDTYWHYGEFYSPRGTPLSRVAHHPNRVDKINVFAANLVRYE